MSVGGTASDRVGESARDEAMEALYTMDVRMYAVDGVVYVCAVVLSALYIVNKSKAPRDVWGILQQKTERAVCRAPGTLHPRVHSRAPSRAPTCAEDEVNGEDPGPSQGLDVRTWRRRIVTTGASSQDAFGRC